MFKVYSLLPLFFSSPSKAPSTPPPHYISSSRLPLRFDSTPPRRRCRLLPSFSSSCFVFGSRLEVEFALVVIIKAAFFFFSFLRRRRCRRESKRKGERSEERKEKRKREGERKVEIQHVVGSYSLTLLRLPPRSLSPPPLLQTSPNLLLPPSPTKETHPAPSFARMLTRP